jgi:CRISPR-associated protein Cmr2
MTIPHDSLWQTKLHARLHGPAESMLRWLFDPAAVERAEGLREVFGRDAVTGDLGDLGELLRRADRWAAADRPPWPKGAVSAAASATACDGQQPSPVAAVPAWETWAQQPVLIHPLTGQIFDPGALDGAVLDSLPPRGIEHFASLVQRRGDGQVDARRTLLAYWRFGPELPETGKNGTGSTPLSALWPQLPADPSVPDHSLWDHLDLASAFAGAFAGDPDGEATLLTVAIGPVQSFIAAARSTSDFWAGSHLLSRLAWEAMKPVCAALGPDAILFPRLRGVPQVDVWLRDEGGLPAGLFRNARWTERNTDANPLFAAALPNRFVAVVPRARARELAQQVELAVRGWLKDLGQEVVTRLLSAAGMPAGADVPARHQMSEQLEGFPEVHWAAVPFSLVRQGGAGAQGGLDVTALSEAMAPFFGVAPGQPAGFLASQAWQVLRQEARWDGSTPFHVPNPGVLYAAIQDLAERALAAAKSVRSFAQTGQKGWRCSLTGETEWLTTDEAHLNLPAGQRRDTLWTRVAQRRPAWARKGEHLGGLPAIKRLWPTLFAEEVGRAVGPADRSDHRSDQARRFVVSTHTMALAHQLDRWLDQGAIAPPELAQALQRHGNDAVALPRRLMRRHAARPEVLEQAGRLPALLDAADELDDEAAARELQALVRRTLGPDASPLETYYGLLVLDGDRMGAWLAGGDDLAIHWCDSLHPQLRPAFDARARHEPRLQAFGAHKRGVTAQRHLALSAALNDYALSVVPHVVESEHLGRLIYAGGDDVLAMLPVVDLLPAMQRLRLAYGGHDPAPQAAGRSGLVLNNGWALLHGRPMRMMGERATASCAAVVAHHQAPLGAVLRELRVAEQRAKHEGERDAFSLTIIKRSGGVLTLTAKWGEPVLLLHDLRRFLAADGVSRRAVYNSLEWLRDLPPQQPALLEALLAHQLGRQARPAAQALHDVPGLARRLAALTFDDRLHPSTGHSQRHLEWLANFMGVAEFLARETRSAACETPGSGA